MTLMLCRNRVADFTKWKSIFDSHEEAHQNAGLRLVNVWRSTEDPNNVFFIFQVASVEQARKFVSDPSAAEVGRVAGVLDGEFYFLESAFGK